MNFQIGALFQCASAGIWLAVAVAHASNADLLEYFPC